MSRVIFHVDVNSAFLSWEATRRVANGGIDLRLIPSVIGGDPTKRTSIVTAKSIPAKKYGIVTGEPVSAAIRKCPKLVIAGSDFELYSRMSRAFKAICREYTPVVEEFSIDECFLDMTTMGKLFPDPVKTAYQLKDRIREELGFTVNVGVAHNKILAKMASDFEKPDKVHTLFEDEIADKMWPLPVGELFLCGKASAQKLNAVHIETIGDLARADLTTIRAILGEKLGRQLWSYANGIDDSPVNPEREAPKGYGNEITFDDNITDYKTGDNVILHLADNVAARVRRDGVQATCVSVTIRGNDMKKHSHQHKLDSATDSTTRVFDVAKELLHEVWDGKTPLRLIGLTMTDIEGEDQEKQLSLFDSLQTASGAETVSTSNEADDEKNRLADKAVDAVREKYGRDIIKRGGMLNSDIHPRKK